MLSRSFCAPLALIVGYAVAVSIVPAVPTTPGLTVKTSTSNINIDGVKNLKVTVTIVNTGRETLKLLNDPHGVLDPFPEDSFNITNPSGSGPSFNGVTVNYTPAYAAGLANSTSSTVLAPGESINVTHDLSTAYNFTHCGAGEYSIEPSNLFTYIDAGGTPKDLYAAVESAAKVKLSGDLRPAVFRHTHDKRATFYGCSVSKQDIIIEAAEYAQGLATESYKYIRTMPYATPRYRTWFGRYSPDRRRVVESVFRSISRGDQLWHVTYDCDCNYGPDVGYANTSRAYTIPAYPGIIWICELFWKYRKRTRGGILLHELTHFPKNGDLMDHFYGEELCQQHAKSNPWAAVENADNYMFFAHNRKRLQ